MSDDNRFHHQDIEREKKEKNDRDIRPSVTKAPFSLFTDEKAFGQVFIVL